MSKTTAIPLFGFAVKGRSVNVSAQRRINVYAETFQGAQQDKSILAFYGRPGLVERAETLFEFYKFNRREGAYFGRGARGVISLSVPQYINDSSANGGLGGPVSTGYTKDVIAGVSGNTFFAITTPSNMYRMFDNSNQSSASNINAAGGIKTTDGYVSLAVTSFVNVASVVFNPAIFELFFVDGVSWYVVQIYGDSSAGPAIAANNLVNLGGLTTPAAVGIPFGATSICSIAQRIVSNDPRNPGRFCFSPPGWSYAIDGAVWDPLDYATAESNPDPLFAVWEINGQLILWGTRTAEFWEPTGTEPPFARTGGTGIQWGLSAIASLAKYNSGTVFLGRNSLGNRQVGYLNGYNVQVISNPDVEADISRDSNPEAATGYTYTVEGHSFYNLCLTDKTWCFDFTSGDWSELQTGADGGKFAGQFGVSAFGKYFVNDYRSLKWYSMEPDSYTDGDDILARELVGRHLFSGGNFVNVAELAIEFEYGTGLNAGQGVNPQAMLQISRDNGHTFGNELWAPMGRQGEYAKRVAWNRLGRARDMLIRLRVTDPVKFVVPNAFIRIGEDSV